MRGVLAIGVAIWVLPGMALAADPATWDCQQDLCTARASVQIAREEGVFDHGTGLSAETDLGRLTNLELQSWREYRFVVEDRARVSADTRLDPGYAPEDWPDDIGLGPAAAVATLHSSPDGEIYQPVGADAVLPAGSYLSVIVTQATEGLDGPTATFYPAKWTLEVFSRRVVAAADADQADPGQSTVTFEGAVPVLRTELPDVATALEAELGCVGLECREPGDEPAASHGDGTPVQGDPADPDAAASDPPSSAAAAPGGDPLAAELQTELARVGCYTVAVDGLWGPGSRRAMADFNTSTGSDFPTGAPTPGALVAVARVQDTVCQDS